MAKSIIIGAATGYTPENVTLFLNSLNKFNYNGKVVLFIHQKELNIFNDFYANQNYSFEVEFIVSHIGLKKMRKYRKISRFALTPLVTLSKNLKRNLIYKLAYPHVSRFFDYYDYLKDQNCDYVMLTDTRDVILQRDPFFNLPKGLYLGLEDKRTLIKDDAFSIRWIKEVYGEDYLSSIRNKEICCAGVTLGDYYSVMSYLKTMNDEFLKLPFSIMLKSNYDQGIHNKLLYSNQFENVILCRPLNSIISTVGLIPMNEIVLNDQNQFLNEDGSLSAIIHQYDRHFTIKTRIEQFLMRDLS